MPHNNNSKHRSTIFGVLPADWSVDTLSRNALVLFSNVDKHIKDDEIEVRLCNYTDVYYNQYIFDHLDFSLGTVKNSEYKKFSLCKGDVVITKDSEDRADIAVPAYVIEDVNNLVCGYHLAIIRPSNDKLDGLFLHHLFQVEFFNHYFQKLANGITRFGLTTGSIQHSHIPLPPLEEQKQIAEIISIWDLAITQTSELIESIKQRNKGLAQQLLFGRKRLKGFQEDWQIKMLGDCAKNVNIRNREGLQSERLYAVTKSSGIIPMREHVKGSTFDKCKIVRTSWFAYNPMRINIGSIAKWRGNQEIMVSGDYVVFKCDEKILLPDYLDQLRNTNLWENFMLIAGNGSVRVRIYFRDLAHFKFPLPQLDEQKAIVNVLNTANFELDHFQQKLDTLNEQKKGLMQKLLTGKVRVNNNVYG